MIIQVASDNHTSWHLLGLRRIGTLWRTFVKNMREYESQTQYPIFMVTVASLHATWESEGISWLKPVLGASGYLPYPSGPIYSSLEASLSLCFWVCKAGIPTTRKRGSLCERKRTSKMGEAMDSDSVHEELEGMLLVNGCHSIFVNWNLWVRIFTPILSHPSMLAIVGSKFLVRISAKPLLDIEVRLLLMCILHKGFEGRHPSSFMNSSNKITQKCLAIFPDSKKVGTW